MKNKLIWLVHKGFMGGTLYLWLFMDNIGAERLFKFYSIVMGALGVVFLVLLLALPENKKKEVPHRKAFPQWLQTAVLSGMVGILVYKGHLTYGGLVFILLLANIFADGLLNSKESENNS